MSRLFIILFLLSLGIWATPARAAELPLPEHAQVKLYSTVSTVAPGQPFTLIIEQLIEPEWHTYWTNPGDSGTPTNVKWNLPDGGNAGALQSPIPSRIEYGPLVNFGYSGRALFAATITPPTNIPGETYTIKADIDWLVCKDICLPEGDTYTLILPLTSGQPDLNHDVIDILRDLTASHPMAMDWQAKYHDENGQTLITFTPSDQTINILNAGGKIEFFPENWGLIENAGEQVLVLTDGDQAMLTIPSGTRDRAQIGTLNGVFVVHDGHGQRLGYSMNVVPLTPILAGAGATEQGSASPVGLLTALFFALLGGIILNLMPCVFPVLSLKILSIARGGDEDAKHLRAHGFAYGAGVIATFLTIAILLMILQQAGAAIGWGFQLQQPIVVITLAYLFTLIGFNLLGWFEIDFGRYIPAKFHTSQDGLIGSFATGVLATVVATPCTAPFMGAALGYALTQHPITGLLVFAMLGLGLALPFIILTMVPHLHAHLPKPGAWMLILRQVLAFPMLITVVWLLWVLGHQSGIDGVAVALFGMILIGFLLWLARLNVNKDWGKRLRKLSILIAAIALLFITLGALCWNCHPRDTATMASEQSYTTTALDAALATNQPVFVNMTAAWCITCKVNERIAIRVKSTQDLFAGTNTIYIKGDWTNYNADITAYLAKFGRKGVPLYIYYPKPAANGVRPEAKILPQLLTPAILRETLQPKAT